MLTPFDGILNNIVRRGYHNHRLDEHSNLMTDQIIGDLARRCKAFARDQASPAFKGWYNVKAADNRTTDYIFGPVHPDSPRDLLGKSSRAKPVLTDVRLLIEHKSVVTAHRNRSARFQDIEREMRAIYSHSPKTIIVATVIIGTCLRVLNVPDCVKCDPRYSEAEFEARIVHRLSTGDQSLWDDFRHCVSGNKHHEPLTTVRLFQSLPTREPENANPGMPTMDVVLLIPMAIDNVNPPGLSKIDGIDAILAYDAMLDHICRAYSSRWP